MIRRKAALATALAFFLLAARSLALENGDGRTGPDRFRPADVFELEWAADPQISPDGSRVVYVRRSNDIMSDQTRSGLWSVGWDGAEHRPLEVAAASPSSPRWSPDGSRLLFQGTDDQGRRQLFVRYMDSGQSAQLTRLRHPPFGASWSPDGESIAFVSFVPSTPKPFAELPEKPERAEWAPPARTVERLYYRADGEGLLEEGYRHLFVLPAEGGTPRQLTRGSFNHDAPLAFSPDGRHLVFSANRHEEWEYDPRNSELYELSLADGALRALTDRQGPDHSPAMSPDGRRIAYLSFDDRYQGYQVTHLYVMDRDGKGSRLLTRELDRSVSQPRFTGDGRSVLVELADRGNGKLAAVSLDGKVTLLARDLGGLSLGRPYGGGTFSLARDGRFAFTLTRPDHPADVAAGRAGEEARRLTRLNDDLFGHKQLASVEEIWYPSSHDGRRIQGWIAKPPGFDPSRKYPLILEIHGGPFADYGDRFAAEIQLYAAAGYVVLYTNPRGSTSYGEEFGNLIHHAYPGHDYDDLMSGVDAVLTQGYVDPAQLFVTGGSGGGVLSSWIVGQTDRFAAAAVQKPVINWYSWVLTADIATTYKYWFPALPWEDPQHYLARSPIQHVGKVTTPTLLITGEADYRTPMSESEQYYQALKLRKVNAALVRIPGAAHDIAARPSHLIAKVAHILSWFERHRTASGANGVYHSLR